MSGRFSDRTPARSAAVKADATGQESPQARSRTGSETSVEDAQAPNEDENLQDPPTVDDDPAVEEDIETDPETQQSESGGVSEDMATLALNPAGFGTPATSWSQTAPRSTTGGVETDDAAIMLRLKAGELQCFDLLMNKYRRPIVNYMYRMVHNQAIAEEMAQEVFLRVYRSRETYRAEAKFSTWLYRIATNLAVNHARDTKNERTAPKVLLDEPDYETGSTPDVADSTPSVEADLLRAERMRAIRQHVMALPDRQRNAVLMHKYQEMDYKQIGAVLKLSESATKSLLFRAYQTLRERLKDFV